MGNVVKLGRQTLVRESQEVRVGLTSPSFSLTPEVDIAAKSFIRSVDTPH